MLCTKPCIEYSLACMHCLYIVANHSLHIVKSNRKLMENEQVRLRVGGSPLQEMFRLKQMASQMVSPLPGTIFSSLIECGPNWYNKEILQYLVVTF